MILWLISFCRYRNLLLGNLKYFFIFLETLRCSRGPEVKKKGILWIEGVFKNLHFGRGGGEVNTDYVQYFVEGVRYFLE